MLRRFLSPTNVTSLTSCRWSMTVIKMPALSPTMEQGKLVEWAKKPGDTITVGDSFCKIETDKAVASFDNQDSDFIFARPIGTVGSFIKVGDPLCLVVDDAKEIDSNEVKNYKISISSSSQEKSIVEKTPQIVTPAAPLSTPSEHKDRIFASPLARVTARSLGVELSSCVGTGGNIGRIIKIDVENAAAKPAPVPLRSESVTSPLKQSDIPIIINSEFEDLPVSMMRSTIARRLNTSINKEVPHFYVMNECRADNMMSTIKHLNNKGAGKYKITVNDYIIKAITRANLIVPACNSHWYGDFIREYKTVDVAVAVATPTGLITPIIRNTQSKGLAEISQESKELAKKAREGVLQPNEYQGGTVTISNMGGMGIPNFTAIINQPHSMILACGGLVPKPEIIKNEDTEAFEMSGNVIQTISFTASFDHRVVDGAIGAEWFKHFKDAIENPLSFLL